MYMNNAGLLTFSYFCWVWHYFFVFLAEKISVVLRAQIPHFFCLEGAFENVRTNDLVSYYHWRGWECFVVPYR